MKKAKKCVGCAGRRKALAKTGKKILSNIKKVWKK